MSVVVEPMNHDLQPGAELHAERASILLERVEADKPGGRWRWPDLARLVLANRGDRRRLGDESDVDLCRAAFSLPEGAAALASTVSSRILQGAASQPDSTEGWTTRESLPNYKPAQLAVVDEPFRLHQVARGKAAPTVHYSLSTEGMRLARFGLVFALDEMDFTDLAPVSVQLVGLAEVGRAAGRVIPDLAYGTLLSNGQMDADQLPIFASGHNNLTTAALADTALYAAMASMSNQTLTSPDGDPIHPNLSPRFLIVPPDLLGTAKALARAIATADESDLIIRAESRLGTAGVLDPSSETAVVGTATNWLLAADGTGRPSVVVATLNGQTTPRVRSFTLRAGQWGVGFDCTFAAAVAVVDYRGLHFSTGAA